VDALDQRKAYLPTLSTSIKFSAIQSHALVTVRKMCACACDLMTINPLYGTILSGF
jgi:hypothetical protein